MSLQSYISKIEKFKSNVKNVDKEYIKLGGVLKSQIIKRSHSGKDANLLTFQKYSKSYVIQKQEAKKKSSPVNMTWSGDMLNSINRKKIANGVRLFFADNRQLQKMIKHIKGIGVPIRYFWGFDKMQIKFINKAIVHILRKGIL